MAIVYAMYVQTFLVVPKFEPVLESNELFHRTSYQWLCFGVSIAALCAVYSSYVGLSVIIIV